MSKTGNVSITITALNAAFVLLLSCATGPAAGRDVYQVNEESQAQLVIRWINLGQNDFLEVSIDGQGIWRNTGNRALFGFKTGGEHTMKVEYVHRVPVENASYYFRTIPSERKFTLNNKREVFIFQGETTDYEPDGNFKNAYAKIGFKLLETKDTRNRKEPTIDAAVDEIYNNLSSQLSQNLKMAILDIDCTNSRLGEIIHEGIMNKFVTSQKYTMISRNDLWLLQQEHDFQLTGAVDDASIVGIGHFLGAEVIITGKLTDEYYDLSRLSFKALDVRTGKITGTAGADII
jgi:hypothetical protein